MKSSRFSSVVAGMVILVALGLVVYSRFEVTTDISHFLPSDASRGESDLARQLTHSELSRTIILLIEATSTDQAVEASQDLEKALRGDTFLRDHMSFLEAKPPEGFDQTLWELYHPRRHSFATDTLEEARNLLSDEGLETAAKTLKYRLSQPLSPLMSRVAQDDPLLIMPGLFDRLGNSRTEGVRLIDNRFITEDGHHAVLFVGTRASSLDSSIHRPFQESLKSCFDAVNSNHGGELALMQSGVGRFAVRAEDAIKSDIQRVSIASIIGFVALFLLLFRSLRLAGLTPITMGSGYLIGLSSCLLIYGRVHGLTLAFGAALIGVSLDYTVHYYCHQTLAPHEGGPKMTLREIWPGLALGCTTTIIGFAALVISGIPGLRELATFGSFGLAGALLMTRLLLPPLMPSRPTPTKFATSLILSLDKFLSMIRDRRRSAITLLIVALLAAIYPLTQIQWRDDFTNLDHLDAHLLAEDSAVRAQVVRYEQQRFVLARGQTMEEALRVNDSVAAELNLAKQEGEISGSKSLHSLLPSAEFQVRMARPFFADEDVGERLSNKFEAEGFAQGAFAPFRKDLAKPPPSPLEWDDLAASPLYPLVRPFRVTLESGIGVLTFLHEIEDLPALEKRIQRLGGASLIDLESRFVTSFRTYRQEMTKWLLFGLLAVLALVASRYRNPRKTLTAVVPPLLAALLTLSSLSLAGAEINLLTLISLLMVISMGVDYGVFLAEMDSRPPALRATQFALVVASLSTVFGFGMLALSDHPALHSIGLTAGLGVVLCAVIVPVVHTITQARENRP